MEDALDDGDTASTIVVRDDYHASTSIFRLVHGDEEDSAALTAELNTYTKEDWALLAQSVLASDTDAGMPDRDVVCILHKLHRIFCHPFRDDYDVLDRMTPLYPEVDSMQDRSTRLQTIFGFVHAQLHQRDFVNEDRKDGRETLRLLKAVAYGMRITLDHIVQTRLLRHASSYTTRLKLEELSPTSIFQPHDPAAGAKHQQVLLLYLKKAFMHGYQKDGGSLYKPRYNEEGVFVHSYEYVCDISEFVLRGVRPLELHHRVWDALTERPGTCKWVIQSLTDFQTEWLPDLKRSRHVHAFRNGLFILTLKTFFYYTKRSGKRWVGELEGEDLRATKYHDIEFDEEGMQADMDRGDDDDHSFMSIDMPGIHHILDTQQFSHDEKKWIFCLLGRLLFSIGQYDNWSVFPYFLGLAGTGKSTLLRLVAELLEKRDVGYLNNQLQKTFALDGISDKLLYLALDIDGEFQLDQATFQSMVCGEEVSVTRKHKQPITLPWESHGGFAGNKLPPWTDNGGSLARRVIVLEFLKVVQTCDPNLFDKCVGQRDRFLKVVVSAYQELSSRYSNVGIKEVMPDKFKKSERKALLELNCLLQFVQETCDVEGYDVAETDRVYTQSFADFNLAFKGYCKRLGLHHRSLTYNFYNGVFAKLQVSVVDPPPAGGDPHGQIAKYILGLRLREGILDSNT